MSTFSSAPDLEKGDHDLVSTSSPPSFPEEPLNLSAADGEGFYPARLGEKLIDRYHVVRKLGWGQYSSIWLAGDLRDEGSHVAIKILTANATIGHTRGHLLELQLLQCIESGPHTFPGRWQFPAFLDHFSIDSVHGNHLCFVLEALGRSVSSLRSSAPGKMLPQHLVKRIVVQTTSALSYLHEVCKIIHTDIKSDNLLFAVDDAESVIQAAIANDGESGEFELSGVSYPIVRSQPLNDGARWDCDAHTSELYTIKLTDLGHSQWADKPPPTTLIQPYALRAPEVILEAGFDTSADIWNLGCLTFELLTGRWLFHPQEGPNFKLEDDHLAKMLEITGERFEETLLQKAELRMEYFNDSGDLLRIQELFPTTFEQALINYKCLPADDIGECASFLKACVRLNPADRATASQLLQHPWLSDAWTC